MATLTTVPTYPVPNIETSIIVSPSLSGTNFYRIWATVAPTGSSIDRDIKGTVDPRNRIEIYSDSGGDDFPLKLRFDKGGKYTFIVQEYIKGSGYGGAYQGDPAGSDSEVNNGSEYTIYVYIGQRLTQMIGPPDNRATLNLWVWNDTVRGTYRAVHGEDTPSITASPLTDRVKSAIESESVKSALSALIGQSSSDALGNIQTLVSSYYDKWLAHLSSSSFHIAADDANVLESSLKTAYSSYSLKEFVSAAISYQNKHFNNDNSLDTGATPPVGPGKGPYHATADRPNTSLYRSVSTLDEAYGGLVDLFRCYELHRVASGSVHVAPDNTNSLPTLSPLMNVHREYLTIIASSNPTPPLAQSTGAQTLISGAGFKE